MEYTVKSSLAQPVGKWFIKFRAQVLEDTTKLNSQEYSSPDPRTRSQFTLPLYNLQWVE